MDATIIGIARALDWPHDWKVRMKTDRWPPGTPNQGEMQIAASRDRTVPVDGAELRRMRDIINQLLNEEDQ